MKSIAPVIIIHLVISLIVFLFWFSQFRQLMSIQAEKFESKEDKVIWAMVLIILNIFGAILFFFMVSNKTRTSTAVNGQANCTETKENSFKKLKEKFPSYVNEIHQLSNITDNEFKRSKNWFISKSDKELVKRYNLGPQKVGPIAFAVLLSVIDEKQIKLNP